MSHKPENLDEVFTEALNEAGEAEKVHHGKRRPSEADIKRATTRAKRIRLQASLSPETTQEQR